MYRLELRRRLRVPPINYQEELRELRCQQFALRAKQKKIEKPETTGRRLQPVSPTTSETILLEVSGDKKEKKYPWTRQQNLGMSLIRIEQVSSAGQQINFPVFTCRVTKEKKASKTKVKKATKTKVEKATKTKTKKPEVGNLRSSAEVGQEEVPVTADRQTKADTQTTSDTQTQMEEVRGKKSKKRGRHSRMWSRFAECVIGCLRSRAAD